jgi:hypothetical protein
LEGEVCGKPVPVPTQGLIQDSRANAIKLRKICIEHHLFVSNKKHELGEFLGLGRKVVKRIKLLILCGE